MASNMKRVQSKTYSAFNALPSLRGKEGQTTETAPERKFKRPPQFADQLLFPGRRLDRRQKSTYSGYSGRSLDIETIVSGGRPDTTASQVGSASHGSLPSAGFSKSLNDVREQSWDSMRQLPSAHSHISLFSRQNNSMNNINSNNLYNSNNNLLGLGGGSGVRGKGLLNSFPGASTSLGNLSNNIGNNHSNINSTNNNNMGAKYSNNNNNSNNNNDNVPTGVPVATGRWKNVDVRLHLPLGGKHSRDDKAPAERLDSSSPDSSYSSNSMSDSSRNSGPPSPVHHPPPKLQLQRQISKASSTQSLSKRPKYLKKSSRRPSEITASSTPQLDKILWALVPDEFANISDTGVSDMDPQTTTCPDTASSRYVTLTDLEPTHRNGQGTSRVPNTPRKPVLTEETLSRFASTLPKDDRIMQWLRECDQQTTSMNLPTHLPDISYTFKFANSNS